MDEQHEGVWSEGLQGRTEVQHAQSCAWKEYVEGTMSSAISTDSIVAFVAEGKIITDPGSENGYVPYDITGKNKNNCGKK
ncbi:MAG: hypothetical protein GF344_05155 [Chitinivibrionales bacterium]|nr:hypothetical protein [Chitinivibrionales bacterium]MBD3356385.1 hypothetical protein [Chitinivibrionales bacterium]